MMLRHVAQTQRKERSLIFLLSKQVLVTERLLWTRYKQLQTMDPDIRILYHAIERFYASVSHMTYS